LQRLQQGLRGHIAFEPDDPQQRGKETLAYTRDLEQELDDIAEGKAKYFTVVSALDTRLNTELGGLHIEAAPELAGQRPQQPKYDNDSAVSGFKCPKCQDGKVRRPGTQAFYSCTNYSSGTGCTYKVNLTIAGRL
jgi:hypothetical protein